MALDLSREQRRIVFICGHYEGIDERVKQYLSLEEISIGDYVLTGGELAALVVIDSAVRLIPGVVGDSSSIEEESFNRILDYPHYTRPFEFRGMEVPSVLLSGDHEKIRLWRKRQALLNTWEKRPDLLAGAVLSEEDRKILENIKEEKIT
jgi:tRNA (guanine37-N1)-methyltransferase